MAKATKWYKKDENKVIFKQSPSISVKKCCQVPKKDVVVLLMNATQVTSSTPVLADNNPLKVVRQACKGAFGAPALAGEPKLGP